MKQVYDNGEMVLGQVYYVKNYIARNISTSDMKEELYEIIKDLEDLDETDIVCVNYDNGMGYTIDYWKKNDVVKEDENNE